MNIPNILMGVGMILSVIFCANLILSIIHRVWDLLKKKREGPPREIARFSSGDSKQETDQWVAGHLHRPRRPPRGEMK